MITQHTNTVVFPKATWEIIKDNEGRIDQIKPIPGTWCSIKHEIPNLLALFCCPNCKQHTAADLRYSKVNHLGMLTPNFKCSPCGFIGVIYFDEYHDKPLYALALVNEINKEIELRYTHADNQVDASKGIDFKKYSVIGIGRAIGYNVLDIQGKELSV